MRAFRLRWPALFAAACAVSVVHVTPARADDEAVKRAREVYEQGLKLHARGDYLGATQAFARADEASPNALVLRAALDESLRADDPALALTLADRASRDASLGERAAAVRARFSGRAGRLVVRCAVSCIVTRDGAAAAAERPEWVVAGRHTVIAQMGEEAETRVVDVPATETVEIGFKPKPPAVVTPASPPAPPSPIAPPPVTEMHPAPAPAADHGSRSLSPVFVYVGAGLTAVLGGATALSGLDTQSLRRDFESRGCPAANGPGCTDLSTRGADARTRTNVLALGTGVIGGATAVLGLFFVRWESGGATLNVAGTM